MRAAIFFLVFFSFPFSRQPAPSSKRQNLETANSTAAKKGEEVYAKKCAICHFRATTEKKIGPGLKGILKRERFQNGMKADEANLRRVIEAGGKDMPGFRGQINGEQLRELVAYLKTL